MTVMALATARRILEASRGNGGTPTRLFYFDTGEVLQAVGTISPNEAWAKFAPYRRHYAGLEVDGMHFTGDVTFEEFIDVLNLTEKAVASGSVTDTSAYTWAFLPTETSDDLKSALFQFGYGDFISTWGAELAGCIGDHLTVTWTKNVGDNETGCKFDLTLMSASAINQITAFTGSLSDVFPTSAVGTQWQVYIDTSTIGTTADTRVDQMTFELSNNFVPRYGADNTGHAVEIVRAGRRITSLTYRRYFNSKAELDAYIAKTTRKVRSIIAGAVVGATTTKNTVQLDYYGVIDSHTYVDMGGGLVAANIKLRPLYDTVLTSDHKWTVINTRSSTS